MTSSPYSENIEIIKGFFRKPIILVLSIMSFVSIIYSLFLSLSGIMTNYIKAITSHATGSLGIIDSNYHSLVDNLSFLPSINIFGVLFALSFLLFFIQSRSASSNLTAPSVIFKIIMIISLVICCLSIAICLVFIITLFVIGSSGTESSSQTINNVLTVIFFILLIIVGGFYLTVTIAQTKFSCSVRKSLTSIYLSRKGSALCGVMYIIYTVISACSLFGNITTLMNRSDPSSAFLMLSNPASLIPVFIGSFISLAENLLFAIVAFQYNSYVKNITSRFATEPQTPVGNEPAADPQPIRNVQEVPIQQYIPNMPAQGEVPPAPQAPAQPAEPQPVICKNCGEQLNPDDYFCNNCGTPIER